jgi:hypothetical protein
MESHERPQPKFSKKDTVSFSAFPFDKGWHRTGVIIEISWKGEGWVYEVQEGFHSVHIKEEHLKQSKSARKAALL